MKITLKELRSLIRESVRAALKETDGKSPFLGAKGEIRTNDPVYKKFVEDIFNRYASKKNEEDVAKITDKSRRAGLEDLYSKLGLNFSDTSNEDLSSSLELTEEQEEKLKNLDKRIKSFFMGASFWIYLENLAGIAKEIVEIIGFQPSQSSSEEKKRQKLEALGFDSKAINQILTKNFAKTSSEQLAREIKDLIRIKDQLTPEEVEKVIDLMDTGSWKFTKAGKALTRARDQKSLKAAIRLIGRV